MIKQDQIAKWLHSPDPDAKGMTRWWWYGCCVDKAEIDRELDAMQAAGIGGVELQILYPVTPDDRENGIYNIPYGSPEFYEIIGYTANACAQRGMACDFTAGSSWPYGGPTVDVEDAQQQALPYQIDVHGPCKYACDLTTRIAGTVCGAVMGKMENCVMLPETVVDITEKFQIKELFGWPWGTELVEIDIPEGDWKICFFVISQHYNHVGKPSRNATGLVLDHCSKRALDRFLHHMVEPVLENAPQLRALFCDSIEVEGHNWSGVLLEEFQRRRGYSLRPYIYALWGDMGEITPHVRYDYFRTMSELTIENFFDRFTDFAHGHHMQSRIQAHGTWGDILRTYAAADIPEGETFGDHRTLFVNTIHRRLAASAGHIYGKPLISNETFTWLKRPRFTETLEEMKAAVDTVFLDGINMIVNHGYAYSPEYAGKRGWPFYASTHVNHTVPWWPVYYKLGNYIQRVSSLLRWGNPVAEVAVYLPQADVYADNMLSELHLAMRLEEHLDRDAMDGIQKAGYWFDYINDEALCQIGSMEDGCLRIGENRYKAIILVGCSRLPVETAEKLQAFAACGGILLCDQIPSQSCGLLEHQENAEKVRQLMAQAKPVLVADRKESLIKALRARLQPDVVVSEPETVGYVHRQQGEDHLYFLSNLSDSACTVRVCFKGRSGAARAWDVNEPQQMPLLGEGDTRELTLCPHGSAIVVFSDGLADAPLGLPQQALVHKQILTNWQLSVEEKQYPMVQPTSWETLPGLAHYSGMGVYECTFALDNVPEAPLLCLSYLSAAAKVWVNGEWVGDIWTSPLSISLQGKLVAGENKVRIAVYSTLINEMMEKPGYEACPDVLTQWPYYGEVINQQRRARLNCQREYNEQKTLLQSGLWGEVSLCW